ncbi:hypothetical protein D3C84_1059270 [compost metagenome]
MNRLDEIALILCLQQLQQRCSQGMGISLRQARLGKSVAHLELVTQCQCLRGINVISTERSVGRCHQVAIAFPYTDAARDLLARLAQGLKCILYIVQLQLVRVAGVEPVRPDLNLFQPGRHMFRKRQ